MIPDDGNYSEYGGKACAHAPVRPLSKKRQHFKKCVRAPLGMSNGFQRRHLSGLLPVRGNLRRRRFPRGNLCAEICDMNFA